MLTKNMIMCLILSALLMLVVSACETRPVIVEPIPRPVPTQTPASPLLSPTRVSPTLTSTPLTATRTPLSPTATLTLTPTPSPRVSCKFDFEIESKEEQLRVMGWRHQTFRNSRAVESVEQSTENPRAGRYSLRLSVNLIAEDTNNLGQSHPTNSKGEAFVELLKPPVNLPASLNLEGVTITIWVYTPKGLSEEVKRPNGLQVFAKDDNDNSEYGTWTNIEEVTWHAKTLIPSKTPPPDGYMDPVFNPQKIKVIGIKVGTGGGSTAKYNGFMFIDEVSWCR